MDFRELQYVVTVADCRNITQASKELFISQPSLSYALAQIEKDVGAKLFDRSHQPLTLTDAGRIYVKTARLILREKTDMKNRIADLKVGSSGDIIVGIPSGRAGYMFRPVLRCLREKYPASQLFLKEGGTSDLLELLQMGKVSFIIVPYFDDELPVGIHKEHIYNEAVPLIAAPDFFSDADFLDKGVRRINLKKIGKKPFIAVKKKHFIRTIVDRVFQKEGIIPNILTEVDSSYDAVQLAACRMGYTIVPQRTVIILGDKQKGTSFSYSDQPPVFPIQALYKKGTYLNKAEKYLIELLKKEFDGKGKD